MKGSGLARGAAAPSAGAAPAAAPLAEISSSAGTIVKLGVGALGLAWSLTTTAAYLPPVLGKYTESTSLIGAVLAAEGVFREDLDPRLASWIFYGGLEEILTGWVLGQLPDGDEEVARAERTIIDVVCGGLTVRREGV